MNLKTFEEFVNESSINESQINEMVSMADSFFTLIGGKRMPMMIDKKDLYMFGDFKAFPKFIKTIFDNKSNISKVTEDVYNIENNFEVSIDTLRVQVGKPTNMETPAIAKFKSYIDKEFGIKSEKWEPTGLTIFKLERPLNLKFGNHKEGMEKKAKDQHDSLTKMGFKTFGG